MEKKDHLIKDSFILFIATSVVNVSNFIFHMYATRKLGPEGYGVLGTVLGMLIIVTMPAMSLQMAVVKRTSVFKANEKYGSIEHLFKKTIQWALLLGSVYLAIFILGSGLIQGFFHIKDRFLVVILGAIAALSLLMPVVRGILQGLQNFIGLGINFIIDGLLRLGFLVLFISFGWGLRGALSTTFFSALCAFIIGAVMISFIFRYKEDKTAEVIVKKEFFSYMLPVFLAMLGFSLLSYMDLFLVKHFVVDEEQAGLYAMTSIIGKAFIFFPGAIVMALFPKVSENHELNKNTMNLLLKSLGLTAAITVLGAIFCYLFPEFVINLLAGSRYLEISGVVKVFGFAILPLVLFNVVINYSLAIHKYAFIYIMYGGVILYAVLLSLFHDTFYHVIAVLFSVNLAILIGTFISLRFGVKGAGRGV